MSQNGPIQIIIHGCHIVRKSTYSTYITVVVTFGHPSEYMLSHYMYECIRNNIVETKAFIFVFILYRFQIY